MNVDAAAAAVVVFVVLLLLLLLLRLRLLPIRLLLLWGAVVVIAASCLRLVIFRWGSNASGRDDGVANSCKNDRVIGRHSVREREREGWWGGGLVRRE